MFEGFLSCMIELGPLIDLYYAAWKKKNEMQKVLFCSSDLPRKRRRRGSGGREKRRSRKREEKEVDLKTE